MHIKYWTTIHSSCGHSRYRQRYHNGREEYKAFKVKNGNSKNLKYRTGCKTMDTSIWLSFTDPLIRQKHGFCVLILLITAGMSHAQPRTVGVINNLFHRSPCINASQHEVILQAHFRNCPGSLSWRYLALIVTVVFQCESHYLHIERTQVQPQNTQEIDAYQDVW